MTVTILNSQEQPLEGVVIMVIDGPVSVPDIASVTDGRGTASLSQLSTPGQYTLQLNYEGQQVTRLVQITPGTPVALHF